MSETRLIGVPSDCWSGDIDHLVYGFPLIADSENNRFAIVQLNTWTLDDRRTAHQLHDLTIKEQFIVFEYAEAKDDPSFKIPIVQGQSAVIIGPGFFKSLSSAFGCNDMNECRCPLIEEVKWHKVQGDYLITLMTIAQRRIFGEWLAEETQKLFDEEICKKPLTEKARVILLVLEGNSVSAQIEYYVRQLAMYKIDGKTIEYEELLMLSAMEFVKQLTEDEEILARKELDEKVEKYLSSLGIKES